MAKDWHTFTGRARDWAIAQLFGWICDSDSVEWEGDGWNVHVIVAPNGKREIVQERYNADGFFPNDDGDYPFPRYPADNAVIEHMIREGIADPNELK